MKDIIIGIILIIVIFIGIDFFYSNKHICTKTTPFAVENIKCGIIKNELDIEIELFDRYW